MFKDSILIPWPDPRAKATGDHSMFKGLGQMGDMAKMMKAAQEMQKKMAALQEDLLRQGGAQGARH